MSPWEAVAVLREEAYAAFRPIRWLRVTTDALAGSITNTPITPERARSVRLRAVEGPAGGFGGVIADAEVWLNDMEILMHPSDYRALLADPRLRYAGSRGLDRIFDIPILR